ncbi:hypothetical protein [Paenibacillus agaridevorans]|uniref:hypothetical protein n=1 Tax=Paenibacillus agaridevorans TaxID=171404 RepID=UPI001BE43FCB|nr:hypothetical protein [Paenibacillus agaridevorans]
MSTTKLNVRLITENLGDELIANMQHAAGIYIMKRYVPIAVVAAILLKENEEEGCKNDKVEELATYKGAYLIISKQRKNE